MEFFTSDTHWGHQNILAYCKRPFANLEEMNEALCDRWNSRVNHGDTVYHLGDFSMGGRQNLAYRKRLNGKIILVRGNHDYKPEVMLAAGFDEVHSSLTLERDGKKLYLSHIPKHLPDPTNRWYHPSLLRDPPTDYDYFLCGHVHEQWKRIGNTINVGVDASNYYPLTLQELLNRDM